MEIQKPRLPDLGAAVRVGNFERYMARFRDEMGQKVAESLGEGMLKYHELRVAPLEARIAYLEAPLWRKAWVHILKWWSALKMLLATTKPVPVPVVPAPAETDHTLTEEPKGEAPHDSNEAAGADPAAR